MPSTSAGTDNRQLGNTVWGCGVNCVPTLRLGVLRHCQGTPLTIYIVLCVQAASPNTTGVESRELYCSKSSQNECSSGELVLKILRERQEVIMVRRQVVTVTLYHHAACFLKRERFTLPIRPVASTKFHILSQFLSVPIHQFLRARPVAWYQVV